jgi:cytoskeletal protein RodZ
MRNVKAIVLTATLAAAGVCGCESKQQKALDQAKKEAAATGQTQQVVSVSKDGTTTTTTVQPPAKGQQNEVVTTAKSKPAPGQPLPSPSGPAVSPAPAQPAQPAAPASVALPAASASVSVPAGTQLAIRIDHSLSSKSSHAGEPFTGEVVQPVTASDGSAVIPKGARVEGEVAAAHRGGPFRGKPFLVLKLTSLTVNGVHYRLATGDLERAGQARGRRTASLIGGGSGLGMLIGGVTHGGVGLVVGGLVGGSAGTAAAGTTGNRNLEIPAETVVSFTLSKDVSVQEAH